MKRLLLFLIPGVVYAQFIFSGGNTLARTESAFPQNGTSIKFILPRSTFWYHGENNAEYYSYSVISGAGINFSKWIYAGAVIPYHVDKRVENGTTVESRGVGDIFLNLKLLKKLGSRSYIGLMPFMTFPLGDLRQGDPDSAKPGTNFTGGLFRDYTSNSYDYGAFILFSTRLKRLSFALNLGGWNGYQFPFAGNEPNIFIFASSVYYEGGFLNPFLEFWYSKFMGEGFGNAPVFFTLGCNFRIFRSLSFLFSVSIPLFERGEVRAVKTDINEDYWGFLSPFPNFTPDYSINMGIDAGPLLLRESSTSTVKLLVIDRTTGSPLDDAHCYLDERYSITRNGMVDFGVVDPGIYELRVEKEGYTPVKRFIKIGKGKDVKIEVELVKDEFVLNLQVEDENFSPLPAKVFFPGSMDRALDTDEKGFLTLTLKKQKGYCIYVWSPGYWEENMFITPPEEKDTLDVKVILRKEREKERLSFPIIYFDINSYKVKKEFLPLLDQVGMYLVEHPDIRIEIDGHASSEGPDEYNYKLSLRRAEACKNYLVERYRIDPERIKVKGFGEDVPVMPNTTEEKRAVNRRVEFRVIEEGEN